MWHSMMSCMHASTCKKDSSTFRYPHMQGRGCMRCRLCTSTLNKMSQLYLITFMLASRPCKTATHDMCSKNDECAKGREAL